MSVTVERNIASEWHEHRTDLAKFMLKWLVNRDDVFGAYLPLNKRGSGSKSYTAKNGKVTQKRLESHFSDLCQPEHIVGVHTISQRNTCTAVRLDIDNHSSEDNASTRERNLAYAIKKYEELVALGLRPLLNDSNGNGGFHISIIFETPIPAAYAYRFGLWLTRDWQESGFVSRPESFPKQPDNKGKFGNWLRLPGRHHTRDVWTTVYNSGQWLDGGAAARAILAHEPVSPENIPSEALAESDVERKRREDRVVPRDYSTIPADTKLKRGAAYIAKMGPAVSGQAGDKHTYTVACRLVAFGLTRQEVFDLMSDWNSQCDPPWGDDDLWHKIDCAIDAKPAPMADRPFPQNTTRQSGGQGESDTRKPNVPYDDPHRLAHLFIGHHHTLGNGLQKLVYWQGTYWAWNGLHWFELKKHELMSSLTSCVKAEFDRVNIWLLENWVPQTENEKPPEVKPVTKTLLNNVENAVASIVSQPDSLTMPDWLCGDPPFPANEVLVTKSTLLHLPSLFAGKTSGIALTPMLFSGNALTYDFDARATCPVWLSFLNSVWADDLESIRALQEWFGLLLLPDTRHHKLLMLIGPPRSGKGTIARVLQLLLGSGNVASPTLSSLAGPFGLWPLLNKQAAIIPDARLSGRDDSIAIVERLLSISGEDPQDIHRKNLPTLTGVRMPVRFTLMSNELPNMRDSSGALMSRIIMLTMTQTFLGYEDHTLGNRLSQELSGILNWSVEGWKRLSDRGYFIQPQSASETLTEMENLSSPIRQFISDACLIGPVHEASPGHLFDAWKVWAKNQGRDHLGTLQTFCKDLRSALPQLRTIQPRVDGGRERRYAGITVKSNYGGDWT